MIKVLKQKEGQALVEYILMLVLAISIATTIYVGFSKATISLWTLFTKEIRGSSPSAPPP